MSRYVMQTIWKLANNPALTDKQRVRGIRGLVIAMEQLRLQGEECPGCKQTRCDPTTCREWNPHEKEKRTTH